MVRIDTPGVMIRIASLFSQHPDLVKGFHNFLPEGYTMELRPDYLGTVVIIIMPNGRDIYVIKPADGMQTGPHRQCGRTTRRMRMVALLSLCFNHVLYC